MLILRDLYLGFRYPEHMVAGEMYNALTDPYNNHLSLDSTSDVYEVSIRYKGYVISQGYSFEVHTDMFSHVPNSVRTDNNLYQTHPGVTEVLIPDKYIYLSKEEVEVLYKEPGVFYRNYLMKPTCFVQVLPNGGAGYEQQTAVSIGGNNNGSN